MLALDRSSEISIVGIEISYRTIQEMEMCAKMGYITKAENKSRMERQSPSE